MENLLYKSKIECLKQKQKLTNILRAAEYAEEGECIDIAKYLYRLALKAFKEYSNSADNPKFEYIPLNEISRVITEKDLKNYIKERLEKLENV